MHIADPRKILLRKEEGRKWRLKHIFNTKANISRSVYMRSDLSILIQQEKCWEGPMFAWILWIRNLLTLKRELYDRWSLSDRWLFKRR